MKLNIALLIDRYRVLDCNLQSHYRQVAYRFIIIIIIIIIIFNIMVLRSIA